VLGRQDLELARARGHLGRGRCGNSAHAAGTSFMRRQSSLPSSVPSRSTAAAWVRGIGCTRRTCRRPLFSTHCPLAAVVVALSFPATRHGRGVLSIAAPSRSTICGASSSTASRPQAGSFWSTPSPGSLPCSRCSRRGHRACGSLLRSGTSTFTSTSNHRPSTTSRRQRPRQHAAPPARWRGSTRSLFADSARAAARPGRPAPRTCDHVTGADGGIAP
jgi:hypothetical protein